MVGCDRKATCLAARNGAARAIGWSVSAIVARALPQTRQRALAQFRVLGLGVYGFGFRVRNFKLLASPSIGNSRTTDPVTPGTQRKPEAESPLNRQHTPKSKDQTQVTLTKEKEETGILFRGPLSEYLETLCAKARRIPETVNPF